MRKKTKIFHFLGLRNLDQQISGNRNLGSRQIGLHHRGLHFVSQIRKATPDYDFFRGLWTIDAFSGGLHVDQRPLDRTGYRARLDLDSTFVPAILYNNLHPGLFGDTLDNDRGDLSCSGEGGHRRTDYDDGPLVRIFSC